MHGIQKIRLFSTVIDLNSNCIFLPRNFNYYNTYIRSKISIRQYYL